MEQDRQNEYQVYLEERKLLITAERETTQQFDKAILTLAAGALALSITFINQIAPQPISNSICYLMGAWILFCLSILSALISFLMSQKACRRQRDILDETTSGTCKDDKNKFAVWTGRFNYCSIIFFILGVSFLIIFSAINLL